MKQKVKDFIVNTSFVIFITAIVITILYLLVSLSENLQRQIELEEKIRNEKYQSPDTPAYYLRLKESDIKWHKE